MNYTITLLNYLELLGLLEKHYIITEDKNNCDIYEIQLEII